MSIHDLAADIPIPKIIDPLEIYFFKSLRDDFHFPVCYGFAHELFEGFPIPCRFVYCNEKLMSLWKRLDDASRFQLVMNRLAGRRLTYKALIGEAAASKN